jgi:hypothetical protein
MFLAYDGCYSLGRREEGGIGMRTKDGALLVKNQSLLSSGSGSKIKKSQLNPSKRPGEVLVGTIKTDKSN